MVEVVFENILSNSIKYSYDQTKIEIDIFQESTKIKCKITDHGCGIPADQIDKIFDRFYRVDESRNSSIPGKGLGLSIVKRITDLLKIDLSIESTLGKGTSITLTFPDETITKK